jgi:hypothetical protein
MHRHFILCAENLVAAANYVAAVDEPVLAFGSVQMCGQRHAYQKANQSSVWCRYTFECSCADQRAMLLRLQQLGAAEQAFLRTHPRAAASASAGDQHLPPQPWRNVLYNSRPIATQLLQDLRRLAIPREGCVTMDFVSHIVRRSPVLRNLLQKGWDTI